MQFECRLTVYVRFIKTYGAVAQTLFKTIHAHGFDIALKCVATEIIKHAKRGLNERKVFSGPHFCRHYTL